MISISEIYDDADDNREYPSDRVCRDIIRGFSYVTSIIHVQNLMLKSRHSLFFAKIQKFGNQPYCKEDLYVGKVQDISYKGIRIGPGCHDQSLHHEK